MKIEVNNNEIRVTWLGVTKVCTFDDVVQEFNSLSQTEQKRQVINLWDGTLFRRISPYKTCSYFPCIHQSQEWNEQAQNELEFIQGADPYLPLY